MDRTDGAVVSSKRKTAKRIPSLDDSERRFAELVSQGSYNLALRHAEMTRQHHKVPIVQFMVDLCYTIVHKSTTAQEWIRELAEAVVSGSVDVCRRLARSYFEQNDTDKALFCALFVPAAR